MAAGPTGRQPYSKGVFGYVGATTGNVAGSLESHCIGLRPQVEKVGRGGLEAGVLVPQNCLTVIGSNPDCASQVPDGMLQRTKTLRNVIATSRMDVGGPLEAVGAVATPQLQSSLFCVPSPQPCAVPAARQIGSAGIMNLPPPFHNAVPRIEGDVHKDAATETGRPMERFSMNPWRASTDMIGKEALCRAEWFGRATTSGAPAGSSQWQLFRRASRRRCYKPLPPLL